MTMKIVFASNNQGKIQELQAMLAECDIEVIAQSELKVQDIPETGLTFVENAIIKARHAAKETGLPAIADDSGLEVFALHHAPGIYSARYAGEKATAQQNIDKLLTALESIPDEKRQARFHCTLVYLENPTDPTPIICEGNWHGVILRKQCGVKGFGYDPVFFDIHENATAAELSLQRKNQISHRGKALKTLVLKLNGEKRIV